MSKLYDVVITGEFAEDSNPKVAEAEFAKLFKLDAKKAESFFSGRKRRIKKSVDHITASKYKSRIERLGVLVQVRAIQEKSVRIKSEATDAVDTAAKTIVRAIAIEEPMLESPSVSSEKDKAKEVRAIEKQRENKEIREAAINAIDYGRLKQARKMQTIEILEEKKNFWLMAFGIICIVFAIADLSLEYLNIVTITGAVWVPITGLIVGGAFFTSSTRT
jgi:hypothetical protein